MDNLTHSLTGLALARAGLDRFSPHATLLLLISANIPDIDIVALVRGPLCYLEVHRGYTHSILFLPLMALLSVLATAAICRQRLPWLNAWLLCVAGVASHLLLDWTNSYGIRLLLPFSSRWFYLDLNSLTDFVILAVLLLAALWPFLSRLVAAEIGERGKRPAGRRMAVFALVFFALFDASRAILHARAVGQLASRLYEDAPPLRAAALPNPVNPFVWRGVVETRRAYRVLNVNTLGEIDPASAQVFYKPALTPPLRTAEAAAPFRYFLYFARFPVWSVEPVTTLAWEGTRLELSDLRFGTLAHTSFRCIAVENKQGR
ncbi:MAG: metal-dependent hydrolase, partial [Bryobacteraceae bacterium]